MKTKKTSSNESGLTTATIPTKLEDDVVQRLTERITDERYAQSFYMAASEWCKNSGLFKAAKFLFEEGVAELEHEKMVTDYMKKWNVSSAIPRIPEQFSFSSFIDIINECYALELKMFNSYITDSYDIFHKDLNTFDFLIQLRMIQADSVVKFSDMLNALRNVSADNTQSLNHFENTYFGQIA